MIIIPVYKLKCIKTFFTDLRTEIEWTSRRVYEIRRLSTQKLFLSTGCIWFFFRWASTYIRMCSIALFIYITANNSERERSTHIAAWKKNTQKDTLSSCWRKKKEEIFRIHELSLRCRVVGWKKENTSTRTNFNPSQQSKSTFYIKFSFTYTFFFLFFFPCHHLFSSSLSLVLNWGRAVESNPQMR